MICVNIYSKRKTKEKFLGLKHSGFTALGVEYRHRGRSIVHFPETGERDTDSDGPGWL